MNQKAIKKACDQSAQSPGGVKAAVSTYISTVWRPFDADKPETWPDSNYAPNGGDWLFRGNVGYGDFFVSMPLEEVQSSTGSHGFNAICDPADLMPGGE